MARLFVVAAVSLASSMVAGVLRGNTDRWPDVDWQQATSDAAAKVKEGAAYLVAEAQPLEQRIADVATQAGKSVGQKIADAQRRLAQKVAETASQVAAKAEAAASDVDTIVSAEAELAVEEAKGVVGQAKQQVVSEIASKAQQFADSANRVAARTREDLQAREEVLSVMRGINAQASGSGADMAESVVLGHHFDAEEKTAAVEGQRLERVSAKAATDEQKPLTKNEAYTLEAMSNAEDKLDQLDATIQSGIGKMEGQVREEPSEKRRPSKRVSQWAALEAKGLDAGKREDGSDPAEDVQVENLQDVKGKGKKVEMDARMTGYEVVPKTREEKAALRAAVIHDNREAKAAQAQEFGSELVES